MKKLLFIMTLCSCVMLFTACGSTDSSRSAQQNSVTETTDSNAGITKKESLPTDERNEDMKLKLSINGKELTATLADSTAAKELAQKLNDEPVTVTLNEYGGFEKVGKLPWALTRSDKNIETEAGDIMLYQGDHMTIFYDSNSWSYTKLGHIDNMSAADLKDLFGEGNITVKLSY